MTGLELPDFTVDKFVTRKISYIEIKDLNILAEEDLKTELPLKVSMGICRPEAILPLG